LDSIATRQPIRHEHLVGLAVPDRPEETPGIRTTIGAAKRLAVLNVFATIVQLLGRRISVPKRSRAPASSRRAPMPTARPMTLFRQTGIEHARGTDLSCNPSVAACTALATDVFATTTR
jgi:hypothetical protein